MRDELMKYYCHADWDGVSNIYAFLADGSQDSFIEKGLTQMVHREVDDYYARTTAPDPVAVEHDWVASEMAIIPDQLLMIEDQDPAALPGSERQWRDYRIALRTWKEGASGFPLADQRPQRPV